MVATVHGAETISFPKSNTPGELESAFATIIDAVDENPLREGLAGTPERAAKAMRFMTRGYRQSLEEIVNGAIFASSNDDMVLVRSIEFYSLCEHHMLPFLGRCHIAYLPAGKVLGLSKLARIVDYHARRLQIQENLTHQIAGTVDEVLTPRGVAVSMSAMHLCMMMRGVEKQNSCTTTVTYIGAFKETPDLRMAFTQQTIAATGNFF